MPSTEPLESDLTLPVSTVLTNYQIDPFTLTMAIVFNAQQLHEVHCGASSPDEFVAAVMNDQFFGPIFRSWLDKQENKKTCTSTMKQA